MVDGAQSILVVEDEPGVRLFLRTVLARQGYAVLVASSAREALRMAAEHPGGIGLAIIDLGLPDLSGRAVATWLRDALPGLPLVFVSGYARHDLPDLDPPDAPFLEKPFGTEELLEALQRALETVG